MCYGLRGIRPIRFEDLIRKRIGRPIRFEIPFDRGKNDSQVLIVIINLFLSTFVMHSLSWSVLDSAEHTRLLSPQ